MQFQNLQVQWESLPKAADAELKPVEKDYLKVLYISWTLLYTAILIPVVIVIFLIDDIDRGTWLAISIGSVLLLASLSFIISTASFKRKAFAIREQDVLYRTGWIIQKLHIVPFNRVQHCVVQSGPIGRRYGLAAVSIYTAASNDQDISIRGLKKEDAETIKSFIMERIQPLH